MRRREKPRERQSIGEVVVGRRIGSVVRGAWEGELFTYSSTALIV